MIKDLINKNFFLLILFSFSIFFSYTSISIIEFRFLYLLGFIFIFIDVLIKRNFFLTQKYLIAIFVTFCIYLHSSFFYFFEFRDIKNDYSIFDLIINEFNFKTFGKTIILFISMLIVFYFKNLIIKNYKKLVDIFIVTFVTLIIIYNFKNDNLLLKTIFVCDLGFFYYTKFLFVENSHFGIISASVITFFFFNIKDCLDKKILFFFYILFFIFSLGSITLTFYFSIVSSILLSLIFCRNKKKYSIYSLVILFMLINFYFFLFSKSEYCKPKQVYTNTSSIGGVTTPPQNNFKGQITSGKYKLQRLFRKDVVNLSVSVQLYSLYFAKNSVIKYPLGVGLGNYSNYRKVFDEEQIFVGESPYEKIIFDNELFNSINAYAIFFNKNTGSNNFSKLIVEFGFLGVILLGFIFYMLCSRKIDNSMKIIFLSLIVNQLFIRGTGYFNNGFLIIIILLFSIFFDNLDIKEDKK